MDKRYQVFVSSTFIDLKDAREQVFQTLMSMDCFPAGMELFPAMDEDQFNFIKRVIDDSDYYLLIVGGRYGSLSPTGFSYTEMEYDYAVKRGLKVVAFLHKKPDEIQAKFTEADPNLRKKLDSFRDKAATGRLVNFWEDPKELPGMVALSLGKTMKTYPAIGWVRADKVASEAILLEQNDLLKELERMKFELASINALNRPIVDDIAGLDETIRVPISWNAASGGRMYATKEFIEVTWGELFKRLAPEIQGLTADGYVNYLLGKTLLRIKHPDSKYVATVDEEVFKTVRIQLTALGFINVSRQLTTKGDAAMFWELTAKGSKAMVELVAVRSKKQAVKKQAVKKQAN